MIKSLSQLSNLNVRPRSSVFRYKGKDTDAQTIAAVEKAAELTKRAGDTLGYTGYVYAAAGKRAEALAIIKELEDKHARKEASGMNVAVVYAGLGEKDKLFEWLEKDFQSRNGRVAWIRWWVAFESIRADARYKVLLKRMNLPE